MVATTCFTTKKMDVASCGSVPIAVNRTCLISAMLLVDFAHLNFSCDVANSQLCSSHISQMYVVVLCASDSCDVANSHLCWSHISQIPVIVFCVSDTNDLFFTSQILSVYRCQ